MTASSSLDRTECSYGVNTTFWTFICSNISYPDTAEDKGIMFSNINLHGVSHVYIEQKETI